MSELLDYLKSLDDNKEDNEVIHSVKRKSKNVINRWKRIKKRFYEKMLSDKSSTFDKLDKLLTDVGYVGNSELIKEIRLFLRKHIDKIHICKFNEIFEKKYVITVIY